MSEFALPALARKRGPRRRASGAGDALRPLRADLVHLDAAPLAIMDSANPERRPATGTQCRPERIGDPDRLILGCGSVTPIVPAKRTIMPARTVS